MLSDALIITSASELTYAEILQKVKADTPLSDLGERMNEMRRTPKSELLLELKSSEGKSQDLDKKIDSFSDKATEVKMSEDSMVINCKDLGESSHNSKDL